MMFIIDYNVELTSGTLFDKQIKVKNQNNELTAKCALENYLKKKYGDTFISLVITDCKEDIMAKFSELFGESFNF